MTELSFDDLDHVSGGPKPLVLIAAFGSGAVLGAALVVGVYYLIK
ncbi:MULTISPECIES: class IIb bacteriocin, lactobin A/cerein 7B family [Rhodospirillales]|nr:class IIb bacteriocin, lactobin A/cerein 7B family [Rhodospirillum centenum]